MGLFNRSMEKRDVTLSNDTEFLKMLGIEIEGLSTDKLKEATYWTCMRIMTDTISKLSLKLFRDSEDNGIEKQNKHYLYNMLKLRPNPFMSSSNFWKCVEFQRNHYGHSVVYIDSIGGRVKALYPLDMGKVQIYIDNGNILSSDTNISSDTTEIWYVYTDNNGKQYKLRSGEVLHFVGLTANGITGLSIRDYLATTIENSQAGGQYVNNYFKGGLQAKGLLQFTGDISTENMQKMRAKFETMASGLKNAGKILPMPLGFSFTPINTTMADAQFLELNQFSIKQITSAFGIKSYMLNDLQSATYSNITEQQKDFYISTLQSILTMYEQELTYKLLTSKEVQNGLYFRFNIDSILRSDIKTRYEAYRVGIQSGFLKINEVRALENLQAAEEGNTLICNGNMIPVSEAGNQYKSSDRGGDKVE